MLILCNDARCKIRKIDMLLNLCTKKEENIMFGCWYIVGQNFGQRKVSEEVIYSILGEEGQRLLSRNTRHCLEYVLKHSKRSLEPYETLQILPRQKYDCAINAVFCYASPFPLTAQRIQKLRSHHHHQLHHLMANIINDLWTRREISDLCQEQHGWWTKTMDGPI